MRKPTPTHAACGNRRDKLDEHLQERPQHTLDWQPALRDRHDGDLVLQCAHGDGQTQTRSAADDVCQTTHLPTAASHPFYRRLNEILREHGFDDFVEAECARFYAATRGRPGLRPGIYFRLLLIGYFEGIDAERGIAWRAADSLALRDFLGVGLDADPPDHSTISRTRRLIALETHRAVFTWVLQCLGAPAWSRAKRSVLMPRR